MPAYFLSCVRSFHTTWSRGWGEGLQGSWFLSQGRAGLGVHEGTTVVFGTSGTSTHQAEVRREGDFHEPLTSMVTLNEVGVCFYQRVFCENPNTRLERVNHYVKETLKLLVTELPCKILPPVATQVEGFVANAREDGHATSFMGDSSWQYQFYIFSHGLNCFVGSLLYRLLLLFNPTRVLETPWKKNGSYSKFL